MFVVVAICLTYLASGTPDLPSGKVRFQTSTNGAYRTLIKQENWNRLSSNTFTISKTLISGLELITKNKQDSIRISILLIPLSKDSVDVAWRSSFPATNNFFARRRQSVEYTAVQNDMDNTLNKFQSFVEHSENIYGIPINETSTKDTLLIATRFKSTSFPSNGLVYSNINRLRSYANETGATESGYPMLNVSTPDSVTYNCMVALPINKIVADKGSVFFVRMVPGRFLTTEVTGGPYTINNAHRMMDQYFKDFSRTAMAIPFESIVTDRVRETDTSKWITRIYGPVY